MKGAQLGRIASHTVEAEVKLRSNATEAPSGRDEIGNRWNFTTGLTPETYRLKIQPALAEMTVPAIASALGISEPY